MPGPADEVWIHHSVTKATSSAVRDMQMIERIGVQRGFGRFSYSYAYHPPTRNWLVGAGFSVGAHTGGRNSRSLGLVVIGNTNEDDLPHFTEDCAEMILWLISRGQLKPTEDAHIYPQGKWKAPGYPTGGHRDQKSTACPGDHAYDLIGAIRTTVANQLTHPGDGFLSALTPDEQRDAYNKIKSIYRHTVEGPDPKPGTDRKDMTWAQRVIESLRRIESKS